MPNPASDIINSAIEMAYNYDTGAGSIDGTAIEAYAMPGNVQQREFGQQAAMAKYANTDAIEERYKTLKKLGINPFTAAEGVAGSSGSTSPAPPSQPNNTNIPASVDSAGNIADRISSAHERNVLLDEKKKNLISDTFLKYKESGYNDELAKNMAIANAYLPIEKYLGLVSLSANIDKLHAEYQSVMQGIDESKKRVQELDAQIELAKATRDLNKQLEAESEKRSLQIEAQTKEQNWLNQQMELYGINPRNPIENNVFLAGVKEGKTSYDQQVGIIRDIQYNNASGNYTAQEEHAYNISYNETLGKAATSWFERPNSMWSTIYDVSRRIANELVAGKISREKAEEEVQRINGFKASFNDFRKSLKEDADMKKKEFKRFKKEHGNDYAGIRQRRGDWMRALNLYEEFDEKDYVDILLNR